MKSNVKTENHWKPVRSDILDVISSLDTCEKCGSPLVENGRDLIPVWFELEESLLDILDKDDDLIRALKEQVEQLEGLLINFLMVLTRAEK